MTYDEVMEWRNANPFEPFRLVTTDGAVFDIRHPMLIWPGSRSVLVGTPDDPQRPDVPGRHTTISMLHVVRIEPLAESTAS
jgi:hypothetical protein